MAVSIDAPSNDIYVCDPRFWLPFGHFWRFRASFCDATPAAVRLVASGGACSQLTYAPASTALSTRS
jgi:hypothetical protein